MPRKSHWLNRKVICAKLTDGIAALSDDESDSGSIDQVPAKATPVKPAAAEEEEDDDEEDEEEYRVEKILKHDFGEGGVPLYQIKWLGYEKKSDLTWEPIENLYATTLCLKQKDRWS